MFSRLFSVIPFRLETRFLPGSAVGHHLEGVQPVTEQWRRRLFESNAHIETSYDEKVLDQEATWAADLIRETQVEGHTVRTFGEFRTRLAESLAEDSQTSPDSHFVEHQVGLEAFAAIVGQYAVDGLTEAQAMFYAVPRLACSAAQMPVVRVLIDEMGCGNPRAAHSQLYRDLLGELGLPHEIGPHLEIARPELLDFVNVFHWMARRAPRIDFYLGALAYTEAAIPAAYATFAVACSRLGVSHDAYFLEHIHIDEFHARDALGAVRLMARDSGAEYSDFWTGVSLARLVGHRAFRAAVEVGRARERGLSWAS